MAMDFLSIAFTLNSYHLAAQEFEKKSPYLLALERKQCPQEHGGCGKAGFRKWYKHPDNKLVKTCQQCFLKRKSEKRLAILKSRVCPEALGGCGKTGMINWAKHPYNNTILICQNCFKRMKIEITALVSSRSGKKVKVQKKLSQKPDKKVSLIRKVESLSPASKICQKKCEDQHALKKRKPNPITGQKEADEMQKQKSKIDLVFSNLEFGDPLLPLD